jgi:multidrug efflux pump subunit AcrA (membrane-fusion protein)
MINDVVYYETTIGFDNPPEGLRPGMTADVAIRVEERNDVLVLPLKAIQKNGEKRTVFIFKNNNETEKEIEVGLVGSNSLAEIVSGLNEGEIVTIPSNKK